MRTKRALVMAIVAVLVTGCSAIRFGNDTPADTPRTPPPPPISAAGSWAGSWEVEGQEIQGTLDMLQSGSNLSARFTSETLGEATGSGKVEDEDRVRLELAYHTQCPGRAQLNGRILDQEARFRGTLVASDCTGDAAGSFAFTRH